MAEDETTKEIRDLAAIVEERSVAGECSNCLQNDWIVLGSPITLQGTDETFACLGMACKNCGFVRLHARTAIKAHW
ncbi:MAG: hypothetical protein QOE38_1285 [Thermoleophilaceae bacterium]|jgi:hypothetical protein|nr:hypothetical protein [Thermoleophilaceae bacterium]